MLMKKICLFSMTILTLTVFTFGFEMVLQNGLDGYGGCEDTYVSDDDGQGGQNKNFGGGTMLSLQGYH